MLTWPIKDQCLGSAVLWSSSQSSVFTHKFAGRWRGGINLRDPHYSHHLFSTLINYVVEALLDYSSPYLQMPNGTASSLGSNGTTGTTSSKLAYAPEEWHAAFLAMNERTRYASLYYPETLSLSWKADWGTP